MTTIQCPRHPELDFAPRPDPADAANLAAIHNELHHGGHPIAKTY